MMTYLQCALEHLTSSSYSTAWLPKTFAKKDKILNLKVRGKWEKGWRVISVYRCVELTEEEVISNRDNYKNQRDVSDI